MSSADSKADNTADERIGELEDRSIGLSKLKQKEKWMRGKKHTHTQCKHPEKNSIYLL